MFLCHFLIVSLCVKLLIYYICGPLLNHFSISNRVLHTSVCTKFQEKNMRFGRDMNSYIGSRRLPKELISHSLDDLTSQPPEWYNILKGCINPVDRRYVRSYFPFSWWAYMATMDKSFCIWEFTEIFSSLVELRHVHWMHIVEILREYKGSCPNKIMVSPSKIMTECIYIILINVIGSCCPAEITRYNSRKISI